jgi:hypothetical protein
LIDSCTAWKSIPWSSNFTSAARSSMLATDNPLMTSAYFIKGQRQDLATFQHILMTYCYVAAARLLRKMISCHLYRFWQRNPNSRPTQTTIMLFESWHIWFQHQMSRVKIACTLWCFMGIPSWWK